MELKERLRRAANLFVDIEGETPQRTFSSPAAEAPSHEDTEATDITARPAQANTQMIHDTDSENGESVSAAGTLSVSGEDFSSIYLKSGLQPLQFSAEQAVEMIRSLPPELPLAMKRQTIGVFLNSMGKALGATPETIVADATGKLAVLAAYSDSMSEQTGATLTQKNQEIAELQAMIEDKRREIAAAQDNLAQILKSCRNEADRIDDVLEFFSLDVPPSRYSDAA